MKRPFSLWKSLRALLLLLFIGGSGPGISPLAAQAQLHKVKPTSSPKSESRLAVKRLKTKTEGDKMNSQPVQTTPWLSPTWKTSPLKAAGSTPTIYGLMVYDLSWKSYDYGIYSYPATDNLAFTPVYINSSMIANGGGVAVGNDYYYVNYDTDDNGEYVATLFNYNIADWTLTESKTVGMGCVASDMTYDPQSGNVYGVFLSDNLSSFVFGVLDVKNGERRAIASVKQQFFTISADADGNVYGIGEDGALYQFDKSSGSTTFIGQTGYLPEYNQSATFDLATGTLYWSANTTSGTCALFMVDTETGKATMVSEFPNSNEVVGTYIPTALTDDDAPAAVEELSVSFTGSANQGTVSFVVPTLTYSGDKELTGMLTYYIYVNDEFSKTGTAEPGELCEIPVEAATGQTTIKVAVANDKGTSPYEQATVYVGYDTPLAVAAPTLKKDGATAVLTWNAPEGGVHGGYVDPQNIKYDVVRYPDKTVVATDMTATTLTDVPATADMQAIYYSVVAKQADLSSEASLSNSVVFGESCGVPYAETFDAEANFSLFTVIDGYKDGSTWFYDASSQSAECAYSRSNGKDEWLITPPLRLKADRKYELSFLASSLDMYQPDNLAVSIGTTPTTDGMTQTLIAEKAIGYNSGIDVTDNVSFTVPADGNYYIGFHATNEEAYTYYLQLDNIRVDESLLLAAPDSVSDLTVTPASLGELQATASFTLPTKTIGGESLQGIDKVEIYVNGKLAQTISTPAVGSVQTATVTTKQGVNTVSVVCSNDSGKGETAEREVFAGVDSPSKPAHVVAAMDGTKQIITWDACTEGVHGGYVDAGKVSYSVGRKAPGYGRVDIIARGLTDTTFTDNYLGDDEQTAITYTVYANQSDEGTTSNTLLIGGEDLQLPFIESFPDGRDQNTGWNATSYNGRWAGLEYDYYWDEVEPQDEDNGFAVFEPFINGSESTFTSARISLKNAVSPKLSFWYYHNGTSNTLDFLINPDQTGWQTVETIDLEEGGDTGWQQVSLSLSDYTANDYIQIGFHAIGKDKALTTFYVDNIRIVDELESDLAAAFTAVPYKVKAGVPATFDVAVTNGGTSDVAEYEVRLYRNGTLVDTQKASGLQSYKSTTVTLTDNLGLDAKAETAWQAAVSLVGDQNAANDTTKTVLIATEKPSLAPAQNLAGTWNNGQVTLTWNEPSINGWEKETEGFEDYKAFTVKNFGLWSMVDVDGGTATYGISDGTGEALIEYPNYTSAMAYQVFNPSLARITASNWQPFAGKQMLASFCDFDDNNDDWLISPELSGAAQTIDFYAASTSYYYSDEAFEVLVSSTDTALTSFTKVYEGSVPMEWDHFSVALPEGTRYFAIRHITDDGFCFLLDDITYVPANGGAALLVLKGYNVYRDGEKLNGDVLATTSFTDENAGDGDHTYTVKAVYEQGEAVESNAVTLSPTGIMGATVQGFSAAAARQGIDMTTDVETSVTIHAANGGLVYSATLQPGVTHVAVPAGVYLVSNGTLVQKVSVR